jgi:hypothetical protein
MIVNYGLTDEVSRPKIYPLEFTAFPLNPLEINLIIAKPNINGQLEYHEFVRPKQVINPSYVDFRDLIFELEILAERGQKVLKRKLFQNLDTSQDTVAFYATSKAPSVLRTNRRKTGEDLLLNYSFSEPSFFCDLTTQFPSVVLDGSKTVVIETPIDDALSSKITENLYFVLQEALNLQGRMYP